MLGENGAQIHVAGAHAHTGHPRAWVPIAIVLAIFVAVATAVRTGATDAIDREILLAMRRPGDLSLAGPVWLQDAAHDFTALGSNAVLFSITAAVAIFRAAGRRVKEAWSLTGCVAGGFVVMEILKASFHRARPAIVPHAVQVQDASFPSGHAMLSAIAYLTLAALIAQETRLRASRIFVWSIAAILVVTIGLTRVYFGVHWPTDVLAGWTAGAAWALLFWRIAGLAL